MNKTVTKTVTAVEEETPPPKRPAKSRAWEVILYPDCPADMDALRYLSDLPRVAYILHDKDRHDDGSLKKPHIHCIKIFNSTTTIGSMEKLIPNVHSNQIQKVNDIQKALRYLTHIDNREKEPYDWRDIKTTMEDKIRQIYEDSITTSAPLGLTRIIDFIEGGSGCEWYTLADVVRWCCDNNLYGIMRQNSALVSQMVRERLNAERESWSLHQQAIKAQDVREAFFASAWREVKSFYGDEKIPAIKQIMDIFIKHLY